MDKLVKIVEVHILGELVLKIQHLFGQVLVSGVVFD